MRSEEADTCLAVVVDQKEELRSQVRSRAVRAAVQQWAYGIQEQADLENWAQVVHGSLEDGLDIQKQRKLDRSAEEVEDR